ncbi:hypothetical protein [Planomonospora parontospora]|uniref:hypothetical protein n=1 Tax=Planomonospora parontospora TaxID=58119 RepID=UPI001670F7B4|nr:hypothetical protein [Planomonospora parontospora]GGL50492.1 hypothetical protein GCM10014719_59740 [Planomonospora parontospora subsp. antibiotica]GII18992.1 hypothetical protein Ppa05_57180 [Planomonospora parontospora subsp. antibiotica]
MTMTQPISIPEVRIEPLSIKGRYFLFARQPPTVMMIDSMTALVVRLAQDPDTAPGEVRQRFRELTSRRGLSPDAADAQFDVAVAALKAAGLTEFEADAHM